MLRAEFAGSPAPDVVIEKTTLHFTGERYSIWFDGVESDAGSYTVAPGETATRTLTLRADIGANAGRVVPCIFQLVGDRLRICFGIDGRLPTHFTTSVEQPRYLATYRRL